jgi:predicted TIM-barrel fold metal-dependent hydrolase
MAGYEIIDVHLHLCRDTAQENMDSRGISHVVTVNIMDTGRMTAARLARLPRDFSAAQVEQTRSDLKEEMRGRVRSFNDWACELNSANPRVIPYVMIDPELFGDEAITELDRCIALGAQGIKVHPSICGHMPDHPAMSPAYERCQERGLGVLSDTTSRINADGQAYGLPTNWIPVLSTFPRLKFIMAHFCDELWDDRVELARQFTDNLWFDMSGGLVDESHPPEGHRAMPTTQAVRVFRKVGIERMLFGSDGPGGGHGVDIREAAGQIVALPFTDEEKEQILASNARRFLEIGVPV